MKILHNAQTDRHNEGLDGEASFRTKDFVETVTSEDIEIIHPYMMRMLEDVHSVHHIRKMRGACRCKRRVAEVNLTPSSYDAMLASASLAIIAAQQEGFAVTRPPGHHAIKERAQGFCFFNNVAVATKYLLDTGKRVCIVDIDGHHGNGTQRIFKKNGDVMYCSIHQIGSYPYTGKWFDIGKGPSFGNVINVPVPKGSGDDILLAGLRFFGEFVEAFSPDYIAVSAGFDGYQDDSLLSLRYTKEGFFEAGRYFRLLERPVFAVLEGGYHSELKGCVDAFVSGVSGMQYVDKEHLTTTPVEKYEQVTHVLQGLSDLLKVRR